jgi:hypothetical protein
VGGGVFPRAGTARKADDLVHLALLVRRPPRHLRQTHQQTQGVGVRGLRGREALPFIVVSAQAHSDRVIRGRITSQARH